MKTFTQPMQGLKEFEDLEAALPKLSGVIQISGCIDAAKPHMMYSIGNGSGNRIIVTFQEQKAKELAEEYRFQILAMEVMPDHIHLLVDCKPQFFISDMIKIMKGNLARQMFLVHPELKQKLWGGHLWNPSYCAVTVSDRSREQVLAYMEGQKEKEKRRN